LPPLKSPTVRKGVSLKTNLGLNSLGLLIVFLK